MMSFRRLFGMALIAVGVISLLHADDIDNALRGSCRITASTRENRFELKLERGRCSDDSECNSSNFTEPASSFTGFSLSDLSRDGSHFDAIFRAEAGTMTCSGSVRDSALVGSYIFEPSLAFVTRMGQLGVSGLDAKKLEAYTLFRIDSTWVESLQREGIEGINANTLIAMRIFNVEPNYVEGMKKLGYPVPSAQKLIALRVHKVEPDEVRQIQTLGYRPTLDELVQMRIFKVTPEFIERMRARGLNNLTISKLVQIRIFKLDE